jgi:DNA primase
MMQNINKIYIFFDGDTAGQQGASKLKELCESLDINVQNIYIADKDPGELSYEQVQKLKSKLYA